MVNWLYLSDLFYNRMSMLSFLLFLSDSHFNCPRMPVILSVSLLLLLQSLLQIWRPAFAHFLIPPEEQHLADQKQNYHTPELDAPILYKLNPLRPGDRV